MLKSTTRQIFVAFFKKKLLTSVLWDLSHPSVDDICAVWRKAARRAWGLPYRTHSVLLAPVSGSLPLLDELACHCVRFIGNCLDSENTVVSHVAIGMQYFLVAHVHLLGSMLSSGAVDTIRY